MVTLAFALLPGCSANQDQRKKQIDLNSLKTDYDIIGPLGRPIGEVVTIEASAEYGNGKTIPDYLVVSAVNGIRLRDDQRLEYNLSPVANVKTFNVGSTYRLRVYQTLHDRGIPSAALEEIVPAIQMPYSYELHCDLVVLNQETSQVDSNVPNRHEPSHAPQPANGALLDGQSPARAR